MKSTTTNRILRALSPTGFSARVLVAVALAGVITSACDVHGVSDPGTLANITVTPNATLTASSTQQMIAVGHDADGRVLAISPTWSVAASGGTINSTGIFSAGTVTGLFTNTVVATVGAISGRASITVTAGALASITVLPTPVTLAVTAKQQFVAVGYDATGNIVQFTPTWSVVAGGGTVDSAGTFTAGGVAGTYTNTVQASNAGIKAYATVTVTIGPLASIAVTPNPATMIVLAKQQFVATGKDVSGNAVAITAVWSVVAGGGAVDGAGLFTAGATPGTYTNTIKATSGTLSGTATVVVTSGPLATITVTPNPATMAINGTQQFTAVGADLAGNPVVITPVWDVATAPNGASITQSGMYTAGTLSGTFVGKVRATSGAMSGVATVIVTAGPLATITVTPNPVFMPTNSTQQFVAVGKDANGNVFVISPVWSVINGGGVVDNVGMFTAGPAAGIFSGTVQAASGAISGTATVNVTAIIPPPPPHPLGLAAPFGILAGTGITCAISGTINGVATDLGSAPNPVYTGFSPAPAVCTYTGTIQPPPVVTAAKLALTTAFNNAFLLPCAPLPFPAGNNLTGINLSFFGPGNPLPPGTYCFSTSADLAVGGILQLNGAAGSKWTFQIGSTLTANTGSQVLLGPGINADNVYWAVGTSATLNANVQFKGNIMAGASITLLNGSVLIGRAQAQVGAVDMTAGGATITKP